MNQPRAIITAVSVSIVAAGIWAGANLPSDPHSSLIDVPVSQADEPDADPVPEPASLGLLGIGISSFITFRRFRKLFF